MDKHSSGDWLSALTIVGRILVFTPILVGLLFSIFNFNSKTFETSIEGPSTVVIHTNTAVNTMTSGASMILFCGLVMLIYVAIKRFQQGYHGELDKGDSGG
jgi:hypothetical protein